MTLGNNIRNPIARSKLNEAEQLLEQGEHTRAVSVAFEALEWTVGRVDTVEPIIIKKNGTSKVAALLQQIGLSHLNYTGGFPPTIIILVSSIGTERMVVKQTVNKETALHALSRWAQIIEGVERHVGSLDTPYGKKIQ